MPEKAVYQTVPVSETARGPVSRASRPVPARHPVLFSTEPVEKLRLAPTDAARSPLKPLWASVCTIFQQAAGRSPRPLCKFRQASPIRNAMAQEATLTQERRTRQRFPLDLPLRFRLTGRGRHPNQGTGRVVDISSQGVAFRSDVELAHGLGIQASVTWPVTLGGGCLLQLSVEGKIVRVAGRLVVIQVRRHEFRTGGRIGDQARTEAADVARRYGAVLTASPVSP